MVTKCLSLFGIEVQSSTALGIVVSNHRLGGEEREEAVSFRAQRSHPAGGWVLVLGWLPSSVLIRHVISVSSAGAGRGGNGESGGKQRELTPGRSPHLIYGPGTARPTH